MYTGPVSSVLSYFDAQFLPCPSHVNPADHLIDVSTIDLRTVALESDSKARVTNLLQTWSRSQLASSAGVAPATQVPPALEIKAPGVPLWRQTWYLTERNFWIIIRDPFGLGGFLFEAIIIGTVVGWIFLKIPGSLTGIRSRQGLIYTVLGLQGYLLLLFTTWKVSVDMKVSAFLFEKAEIPGL